MQHQYEIELGPKVLVAMRTRFGEGWPPPSELLDAWIKTGVPEVIAFDRHAAPAILANIAKIAMEIAAEALSHNIHGRTAMSSTCTLDAAAFLSLGALICESIGGAQ